MEKKSPLVDIMIKNQEYFYLVNIFYLPVRFQVEDDLITWVDDNTEYGENFGFFNDIEKNLEGLLCW